jgi:hypothetical protein
MQNVLLSSWVVKGKIALGNSFDSERKIDALRLKSCILRKKAKTAVQEEVNRPRSSILAPFRMEKKGEYLANIFNSADMMIND